MSRNYEEIEWTLAEIQVLQKANEMVQRGGYHLADILNFLNENLRADKRRHINIPKPKEVSYEQPDAEH